MKKEAPHKKAASTERDDEYTLLLINDDFNTFEHVIRTLVEVCGHDPVQAEQCALITHFRGTCGVKNGQKQMLIPMSRNIGERGLMSEVIRRT
jgi:ATP-dependent Clp protease adaptor protein ClpS